ncbi:MAG: sulfotransferase [Candidatus Korobacteraceae bacterium]
MTPEFELLVQVVLENGLRMPVGRIRGRHRAVPSRFEPTIQPLLVNSLARTGTTWLMRLLLEHPSIAAFRVYPYEIQPGRYWMQLVGAMAEPAYQAQALSKLGNFEPEWWAAQDPFQRGSLPQNAPWQQWFNSRFVEQVATLCQRSLEDCYREIATVQNQGSPIYFAEKHIPDEVPGIIWELYSKSREIFLVRDPRDMLCSIRAFNAKRGTLGFNRDLVASEEEYILRLGREGQQLLSGWKSRSQRACLVRYEDLVLQPIDTLREVLSYLEVESGNLLVEGMLRRALVDTPELEVHRTSETARASIGRWRDNLDSSSQLLCEHVFVDLLKEFGYDLNENLRAKLAEQSR